LRVLKSIAIVGLQEWCPVRTGYIINSD